MVTWKNFQDLLREIRTTHRLSQEKCGNLMGCGRIHINRLENGIRKPSKFFLYRFEHNFSLDQRQKCLVTSFRLMIDHHYATLDTQS